MMWALRRAPWIALLGVIVALVPLVAEAQSEPPSVGVWAGYSYLPELDSVVQSFSDSGHGLALGLSLDVWRDIGIAVDFDTHRWTVHEHGTETFVRGDQDIRLSYLSTGPRFAAQAGAVAIFGLGTFDLQWSRFSEQTIMDTRNPDNRSCCEGTSFAFGFGFGTGVDVDVSTRITLRAIQVNYSLGGFGEGPGRKLRLKSGIVLRF